APMKKMKSRQAPVEKTTRATRAPSIEVMKFFMTKRKLACFSPSTSPNGRFEEVTQERVASPCDPSQCSGHERAKGTPDHESEGAHDQPRRAQVRHVCGDRSRPGGGARVLQAGGASGTIAKSISAYDMVFSDAIYGKAPRY